MFNKQLPAQILGRVVLTLICAGALCAQQRSLNLVSRAQATKSLEFDVFLPLENVEQLNQLVTEQQTPGSPNYHKWLTPAQFQSQFGPNPAALSRAASELRLHGLTVTATHTHGLHVAGTVGSVQRAFGITLWNAENSRGRQRLVAKEPLALPASLQKMGARIVAFSPVVPRHGHSKTLGAVPFNRYSTTGPYWFTDMKQAYQMPSYQFLTGHGVNVAIVMWSDMSDDDLAMYFGHENLSPPTVVRRPVLGGPGPFNPADDAAIEASLDVQQAGGMAPGATINLYDIPDPGDDSILAAYQTIVDDNIADIVSSSFGAPEQYYTAAYQSGIDFTYLLHIYHEIFLQGNAQGITFVASSGDNGGFGALSLDLSQWIPAIENPADDPNVTAVGGTNLITTFSITSPVSRYVRENAFFDPLDPAQGALPNEVFGSGGGKSIIFPKPAYQRLVDTGADSRAIPDVSMQMGGCPQGSITPCPDNRSATIVALGGVYYEVIGTSVSAPDFAGVLALAEENLGTRLGNVNFGLYAIAAAQQNGLIQAYHQGIPSDNGVFQAPEGQKGYNMVVGNGTPIGINLLGIPTAPVAGNPGTPSNP